MLQNKNKSNNKDPKNNGKDSSNNKLFNDHSFYTNKRAPNNLSYGKSPNPFNSAFKRCNISTRPDESFLEDSDYYR